MHCAHLRIGEQGGRHCAGQRYTHEKHVRSCGVAGLVFDGAQRLKVIAVRGGRVFEKQARVEFGMAAIMNGIALQCRS